MKLLPIFMFLFSSIIAFSQITGQTAYYALIENGETKMANFGNFDKEKGTIEIEKTATYIINLNELPPFSILGIYLNDLPIKFPKSDEPEFNLKKGDIIKILAQKDSHYQLYIRESPKFISFSKSDFSETSKIKVIQAAVEQMPTLNNTWQIPSNRIFIINDPDYLHGGFVITVTQSSELKKVGDNYFLNGKLYQPFNK